MEEGNQRPDRRSTHSFDYHDRVGSLFGRGRECAGDEAFPFQRWGRNGKRIFRLRVDRVRDRPGGASIFRGLTQAPMTLPKTDILEEALSGVCTVCRLPIADTSVALAGPRAGTSYPFCSQKCMKEFYADPERYLTFEEEEEAE